MATSSTPSSVTSLPSPTEQHLMDTYQLLFTKPCSVCGCNLARTFYEHTGCVRCYPARGYHVYADQMNVLYPRRHIELLK